MSAIRSRGKIGSAAGIVKAGGDLDAGKFLLLQEKVFERGKSLARRAEIA